MQVRYGAVSAQKYNVPTRYAIHVIAILNGYARTHRAEGYSTVVATELYDYTEWIRWRPLIRQLIRSNAAVIEKFEAQFPRP